jgi:hypothetical protein
VGLGHHPIRSGGSSRDRSNSFRDGKGREKALERARASGKAACVNVMIDPSVYSSGTRNQTMDK